MANVRETYLHDALLLAQCTSRATNIKQGFEIAISPCKKITGNFNVFKLLKCFEESAC